jgi:ligand-binding sensor domain-containing protein
LYFYIWPCNHQAYTCEIKTLIRFRIYLQLFFFASVACLYSQTPSFNFQKLGSEEGLNNANIFNIEQQASGLMYFTTQNGIYYYDGNNFNKLAIDSLKSNALLNVSIKNARELYLSIRGEGIFNFDLKTRRLAVVPNLKFNNNADNFIITDNFAFLLTSGIKLNIANLKTGQSAADPLSGADKLNLAYCLFKTRAGKILVGRTDGLYDATDGTQKKLAILSGNTVHAITETSGGDLVVGTSGKIFIIRNNAIQAEITPTYTTKSPTFQLGGEKSIDKVIADNFGRIWFTSYPDETLYLYQNNKVYDLFSIMDISPTLINCLFKDEQQNIWIGTYNDGVYYIQNPFFNSINVTFNNNNLNVNQVYLKGNLLVAATSNGLYGLNLSTNQTKVISKPDEILVDPINSITEWNGAIYYSKNSQFNLSPDILLDSKNAYKFKPVVGRQFYPISDQQSVVVDFLEDILLCNIDGTKVLDTLISFPDYRISVNALLKWNDSLYVGTSNGLFIYNFKTKIKRNLVRSELNFNINDLAIINKKLYAAHEAGITNVTEGKLMQQAGSFRLNSVRKIKQRDNQIWLATLDGVFICNQNFEPVKILNKANGLLSNSINDIAFNEQTVSIATARGIATSNLKNIRQYSSKLKPVTISHINCNGENLEVIDNTISLKADQEDVTIYFYSPFFNKPNKQFFRYTLNNSEWKVIDGLSLNLQLAGGLHRIEISASADNIVWSDNTVLQINKEEKLSEKQAIYWLITLGALLLVSAISFIWIKRVKIKAKRRLQEEQQVNLLKHQAMNSLLSPHFIFNSLTSIQNYINTNNSLKASEYLAKFSRLIRMIIEKASQSNITLYDELARLTYYLELEKERFKNKFDYVIHIDEGINTHEISIPNMIIQPHVENCIIHGILPKQEHGTLHISFKQEHNKFLITIEDNGIGLIKAKEHAKTGHKSLGTSTIKNILEINSKLTGKKQRVSMVDKSTLQPELNGTLITIELDQ